MVQMNDTERMAMGNRLVLALVPKIPKSITQHEPRARRVPGSLATMQSYFDGVSERGYGKMSNALGWVYVVRLIPDVKPERVKIGFTNTPWQRRRSILTVAPGAQLEKLVAGTDDLEVLGHRVAARIADHVGGEVFDFPNEKTLQWYVRHLRANSADPLLAYDLKKLPYVRRNQKEKQGMLESGATGEWI